MQILWNKPGKQVTVFAEITEATLRVLPALLDPAQDGYDDTANITAAEAADVEDLFETPIIAKILHKSKILHDLGAKGAPGTLTYHRTQRGRCRQRRAQSGQSPKAGMPIR